MDDPLCYDTPEEPSVEHLAQEVVTDFIVYESGSHTIRNSTGSLAEIFKEGLRKNPSTSKNIIIKSYARGSAPVQQVVTSLRWTYSDELKRLESSGANRELNSLEIRRRSYLTKLLAQSDGFFIEALEMTKPLLAAAYGKGD